MPLSFKRAVRPEWLLAAAAIDGAGLLAGFLADRGQLSLSAGLATLGVWGLGAVAWRLANAQSFRFRVPSSELAADAESRWLGAAPLLPWLASWPLLVLLAIDPLARAQLFQARLAVGVYLLGWLGAGLAALALWVRAVAPRSAPRSARSSEFPVQSSEFPVQSSELAVNSEPGTRNPELIWLAWPLFALVAVAYWNGAVLDPLQFRGFPDYVTQMGGARRLLAGQLPYNPDIRVWTDVNLPPITLLLLFAPFTLLSELAGKLVYFTLNHAAFLVGVALLVVTARPPGAVMGPLLWTALLAALGLTFEPWHDSLRLGQQNGIVFLCLVLALVALCQRRDALAGVALAAAFIGKPSSALLGLYLLYAGRWRAIAAGAVCGLGLFAVTLPWTGVENWRYYLLEKAPQILAGTPQQSNVALLALHARLFLPREALSSFDAMPLVPAAQWMTRVAQVLGALALWGVTRRGRQRVAGAGAPGQGSDRLTVHLEFAVALVLSLSLVGHAWQSYVTWLILAFAPLADPRLWQALPPGPRRWVAVLAGGSYAALALHDVALYKVIGTTTPAAAAFASLPNVALLVLAFALAVLHAARLTAGASRSGFRVPRSWLSRDSELGTGNAERRGQRGGPRR